MIDLDLKVQFLKNTKLKKLKDKKKKIRTCLRKSEVQSYKFILFKKTLYVYILFFCYYKSYKFILYFPLLKCGNEM